MTYVHDVKAGKRDTPHIIRFDYTDDYFDYDRAR
jgi:hypothetical protein